MVHSLAAAESFYGMPIRAQWRVIPTALGKRVGAARAQVCTCVSRLSSETVSRAGLHWLSGGCHPHERAPTTFRLPLKTFFPRLPGLQRAQPVGRTGVSHDSVVLPPVWSSSSFRTMRMAERTLGAMPAQATTYYSRGYDVVLYPVTLQ